MPHKSKSSKNMAGKPGILSNLQSIIDEIKTRKKTPNRVPFY